MSPTPDRLQIAARIHFLLLREIGQGIDIEQMLKQPRYERDVLLVCDACRDTELARLAQQYRQASTAAPRPPDHPAEPTGDHGPPSTAWGRTSTGFGASRPLDSASGADVGTRKPSTRTRIAKWWKG